MVDTGTPAVVLLGATRGANTGADADDAINTAAAAAPVEIVALHSADMEFPHAPHQTTDAMVAAEITGQVAIAEDGVVATATHLETRAVGEVRHSYARAVGIAS